MKRLVALLRGKKLQFLGLLICHGRSLSARALSTSRLNSISWIRDWARARAVSTRTSSLDTTASLWRKGSSTRFDSSPPRCARLPPDAASHQAKQSCFPRRCGRWQKSARSCSAGWQMTPRRASTPTHCARSSWTLTAACRRRRRASVRRHFRASQTSRRWPTARVRSFAMRPLLWTYHPRISRPSSACSRRLRRPALSMRAFSGACSSSRHWPMYRSQTP